MVFVRLLNSSSKRLRLQSLRGTSSQSLLIAFSLRLSLLLGRFVKEDMFVIFDSGVLVHGFLVLRVAVFDPAVFQERVIILWSETGLHYYYL